MIVWLKKIKFDKVIQENLDGLLQLAYMRCTDRELAEDLVQDACIKAYNSYLKKNDEITNVKSWLYRILINTHIDFTRKKKFNTVPLEELDFRDKRNHSKNTETNFFFRDLQEALKNLETEQRIVIYLADINEYSYKEIADLLEVPLGTVMSRLYRARQSLRKLLSEKGYSKEYIKEGEN